MGTKKLFILFSILLSMAGTKALAYDISAANANGVTIYYNYINNGTELEVAPATYSGSVVIPEEVTYMNRTKRVTRIASQAFYQCSSLTSVTIPNSVTSIGSEAFEYCSGLTSVTIGNSVEVIGYNAFCGCSKLTSIVIPDSVTCIESRTFYGCSGLTSVTIGNSVEFIRSYAFYGCSKLTSIVIPNSVIVIDDYAFYGCIRLTSVTIGRCVSAIRTNAFYGYDIPEIISKAVIPPFLSSNVFSTNTLYYAELSVPEGSADLYKGDSNWKAFAFIEEARSYNIAVENAEGVTINYNFINDGTELEVATGNYSGSVVIPEKVEHEGVEYSVTSVGGAAFYRCSGLTSITIPNSVTSIGNNAFRACTSLTSVTIPNSVTTIGNYAFSDCTGLTSIISEIEDPFSITHVFSYLICYCGINDYSTNLPVYGYLTTTLYVPAGTKTKYETTIGWKVKNIVEMEEPSSSPAITFADANVKALCVANWDTDGDGELSEEEASAVTDLGKVFQNNKTITSFDELQYFTGLTSIGDQAFYDCSGLTSITIPNSVTSIGSRAFMNCSTLTSIIIPNSVTSIGSRAFMNCSTLTSIIIPNNVTSIGEGPFVACPYLSSITVNRDNTVYDSRNNCNAIIETASNTLICGCKNTTIPNSVTSIGIAAFYDCSGLTSITIPNSVTSIGEAAFYGCIGLTPIEIPNSVTSIGIGAFMNCSALTSITIPNNVTSIGGYAFCGCSTLSSVIVEWEEPVSITKDVFTNFANATLYIPAGSKATYEAADYWKEFKEIVEMGGDDPDVFTAESIGGVQMTFKITDEANKICQIGTGNGVAINVSTMGEIILPPTANGYTVTSIADNAFANCTSIYCVYIPNTIQSIGENAFNDCTMLSSVKSYIEKPFDIPASAFANISSYASLDALYGTKEKYQTVTGWNVFYSIYAETAIVNGIRYSVNGAVPEDKGEAYTAWVKRAIWNNYEGEVVIPEVLTIGDESFTVVGIDDGAFYNSQITSVTIPSTVRSIDSNAFENCLALNSITSYIMEPQDVSGSFVNIPADATLYVPAGTKSLYENAGGWNQFTTIIEKEAEDPNPDPDPEQIEVTDISQMDNAIYIEPFTARVGDDVEINVSLKNAEAASAYNFELVLPGGISINVTEENDFDEEVTLSSRNSKHQVTTNKVSDNVYRLAVASLSSKSITGNDGVVLTILAHVSETMLEGTYPVQINSPLLVKADGTKPAISATVTTVTVEDYVKGDVDGDGVVDLADAVVIINYCVGKPVNSFVEKAADADGDGVIDLADAVRIINYCVGKIETLAREMLLTEPNSELDPE